ncbi:Magnesium transporter MRS2-4 [Acorus gramineus]|uniref:Magnesium transporter MRS2-4 n=1 Tax=Acorus gramineus TaxID=55184 RepID=A0AAV9BII3_ACOGR|nr:Magnesium transporter MRS2-4 [Acorus gramineus]
MTTPVNGAKKKACGSKFWLRLDGVLGMSELIEFDKSAILRWASIPARDLRILGPVFSQSSNILGDLGGCRRDRQ